MCIFFCHNINYLFVGIVWCQRKNLFTHGRQTLLQTYLTHIFLSLELPLAQLVKNQPAIQETLVRFLCQEDPWRMSRLPTPIFLCFPGGSAGKKSTCNCGRSGFDPWVGKIPWRKEQLPTPVKYKKDFFFIKWK